MHRPPAYPPDPETVRPRLWRSASNKMVAGVIGGLAERMDVDARMLRIIAAMGIIMTGVMPGVVLYLLFWMITRPHDVPRPYH